MIRDWIIKNWAYSYDTKFLGNKGKHLRVVNTLIVLFCIAGLYNLLTVGFDIWQGLAFLPFLVIFFGGSKLFLGGKPEFDELDWEQKLQVLQKPYSPYIEGRESLLRELKIRYDLKYKGRENFIHAWRIILPFLVILLSCVIYWFFGFNEVGFTDQRFF